MKNFTHPLFFHDLCAFCHPRADHPYHDPAYIDGMAKATNGHIAIIAHRGLWAPDDFPKPTPEFLQRWTAIPWKEIPHQGVWFPFDDFRGMIFRRAMIAPFTSHFKISPTPAVLVDRILVPLSMLQLAARLPRCEFTTHDTGDTTALHFRFSGGSGLIAASWAPSAAFTITPVRKAYDGHPIARETRGNLPLPGWPPVDTTPT